MAENPTEAPSDIEKEVDGPWELCLVTGLDNPYRAKGRLLLPSVRDSFAIIFSSVTPHGLLIERPVPNITSGKRAALIRYLLKFDAEGRTIKFMTKAEYASLEEEHARQQRHSVFQPAGIGSRLRKILGLLSR